MPDRKRNYDKSPAGIAYRHKYNDEHYKRLDVYVTPELRERIDKHSADTGQSKNQIVVSAITEYLDKHQTE